MDSTKLAQALEAVVEAIGEATAVAVAEAEAEAEVVVGAMEDAAIAIEEAAERVAQAQAAIGVPPQVWRDLEYEVARHGLEYADNFRAYRVGDRFGFEDYKKAVKRGCCGSFEGSTIVGGQKWVIGCNYGH